MIPDCYDPAFQEERRQREWDEWSAQFPECICCGHRIFPGKRYRTAFRKRICEECVAQLIDEEDLIMEDGTWS